MGARWINTKELATTPPTHMFLSRAGIRYHPLVVNDHETSIPRPWKQHQAFAKGSERCYVPPLNRPLVQGSIAQNRPSSSLLRRFAPLSDREPPACYPNRTLTKPDQRTVVVPSYSVRYATAVATIGCSPSRVEPRAWKSAISLPGRILEGVPCCIKVIGREPHRPCPSAQ